MLPSRQQCMDDPVSMHPYQHFVQSLIFYLSHFEMCMVLWHCDFNLHFHKGW